MKRYLEIAALLILSIPAGFLTIVTQKPYPPRHEYTMILIAGTIACIIVLGGISWLVYFTLKRQKSAAARKRAFQVYGFLAVVLIAVGSFKFPGAMKERDRIDFLAKFDTILTQIIDEKIQNQNEDYPPSVREHSTEIAICTSIELGQKNELVDQLIAASDPKQVILNDKEIGQMIQHCIDLYKN